MSVNASMHLRDNKPSVDVHEYTNPTMSGGYATISDPFGNELTIHADSLEQLATIANHITMQVMLLTTPEPVFAEIGGEA